MNENDRRVKRTRRQLQQALIELVSTQSYDSITVQDITKQAQVGNKTFYRHFEGKDALLQSLVDKILTDVPPLLLPPADERAAERNTMAVLTYAETHAELILTILNSSAVDQLLDAGIVMGLEEGRQTFRSRHIPDELMAHHFASSMISVLRWWLESERVCSKEEMARYMDQLVIDPLKRLGE